MCRHEDVYEIELQNAYRMQRTPEMTGIRRSGRPWPVESLRGERYPTSFAGREAGSPTLHR
jgi:hypothetical protein